jgi:hypothetical protein
VKKRTLMFSSDLCINVPELLINDRLMLQMNLDGEVSEGEDGHAKKWKIKNKKKTD